ncbi:hypothetical protein COV42_02595 [Candidatus Campbellbacteria bacterium CG11_big_fil_rev_8_21_14_0_20_44_21]|uniref:Uncharacterized protein n=1 Tax=Candidatus Campbellbacteria bacterium CG22_combo_CG10-13_8_21_14_all_43_18 TaxID=1974530 RepID=A0A2H0DX08_9BACT|nr:MAG: hypothetical protein COW82_00670 [Candidatus Campbellbacteria bacterium CG22_combo_CG10-13_8_21_14_all_43_18]PIR24109.1 MAG: hypothetical protein COV42_02595 [Candidatus Campbellbacteria bacterium CG11_big_fil_rev_8_21_14_0_20_44_21]
MKNFFSRYRNVILAVAIAVLVFFLYKTFLSNSGEKRVLLGTDSADNDGSAASGREFLTTLLELRSLELDESIFSDRAFVILRDFSREVSPQPSGRPNPFAEIGNEPAPQNEPLSSEAPEEKPENEEPGSSL